MPEMNTHPMRMNRALRYVVELMAAVIRMQRN